MSEGVHADLQAMEVAWDYSHYSKEFLNALFQSDASLAPLLHSVAGGVPVAKTCRPFKDGKYWRPAGHARSFFTTTSKGSVVFKGTEPFSTDYQAVFEEAATKRLGSIGTPMDHFTVLENEVYLALALLSTGPCVQNVSSFVQKYYETFSTIPRAPIPLFVHTVPAAVADRFIQVLSPFMSKRRQHSAQWRLQKVIENGGLCTYTYYYPGIPLRAGHARNQYPGSFNVNVAASADQDFNVLSATKQWCNIVAEMLISGFLPTTLLHTGHCLQVQNLVIDGGICDLDSIEPMADVVDDANLNIALFYSLGELARSVTGLLSGPDNELLLPYVWGYVFDEVRTRVQQSSAKVADPRIVKIMQQHGIDGLSALLKSVGA